MHHNLEAVVHSTVKCSRIVLPGGSVLSFGWPKERTKEKATFFESLRAKKEALLCGCGGMLFGPAYMRPDWAWNKKSGRG